jgi:hypothetical protein
MDNIRLAGEISLARSSAHDRHFSSVVLHLQNNSNLHSSWAYRCQALAFKYGSKLEQVDECVTITGDS